MVKKKWPKKLLAYQATNVSDDPVLLCAETPEDIAEEFADEPIAVYELVAVGKFSVEKQIDAKLVSRRKR